MTPNPAQIQGLMRVLLIYGVCATLGIFLGITLSNPLQVQTYEVMGILLLALALPLWIHWNKSFLLLCWNCSAVAFFLSGQPGLSLAVIAISLTISLVERAINPEMRFVSAPQLTYPLLAIVGVMLVTAHLTGGIGLRSAGSQVYGGQKYVWALLAIAGYFAITAHKIPLHRAKLFIALFFLGTLFQIIGDLRYIAPGWSQYILAFFPANYYGYGAEGFDVGTLRLPGFGGAGRAIDFLLLAIYGVRGIFLSGKLWRPCLFIFCFLLIFLGGFRGSLLSVIGVFIILFFMEGLHQTRMLLVLILAGLMMAGLAVPFARHLPYTFQRTLTFVPSTLLDLSSDARKDAQSSLEWRELMWKGLLPEVPKHLLLGEGYAIRPQDFETEMGRGAAIQSADPGQQALALSHDYHNAWFGILIPFGIWGMLAYLWFLFAGLWAVYSNYRYGKPELRLINSFLFAYYLWDVVTFMSFYSGVGISDLSFLTGKLGLSVAINGGIRRPDVTPPVMKMRVAPRVRRFPVPELPIPRPPKTTR